MLFHRMSKIHLRSKIQAQGHTRGQTHAIPMEDLVLDMLSVGRDGSERGSEANSIRSDEAQLQHQISFEDLKWRSLSIPHYESYLNVALALHHYGQSFGGDTASRSIQLYDWTLTHL